MKKLLKITALLIILSVSVNAQFIRSYGIKAGTVNSNLDFNYLKGRLGLQNDPRWGFAADAFIEFLDVPFISVVTSINYLQLGAKQKYLVTGPSSPTITGNIEDDNRIDYFGFSVMGKLRFSFPVLTPYVFAGPQFNIETVRTLGSALNNIYNDYEKNNWTLGIGAGTELGFLLPVTFLAEIQYNLPLSTPYKTENLEIKNNSFELKAGIAF